jgi:hypothetical protein
MICLSIIWGTYQVEYLGVFNINNAHGYYSPTVGQYVQTSYSSITTYTGSKTGVMNYIDSEVLQAGYVAN